MSGDARREGIITILANIADELEEVSRPTSRNRRMFTHNQLARLADNAKTLRGLQSFVVALNERCDVARLMREKAAR